MNVRGSGWLSNMRGDVRVALRGLARSPGFTVVAVLSLALGIGANTAIFSLVNGILLRSLPLPNPQELRVLTWTGTKPRVGMFSGAYQEDASGLARANAVSDPVFEQLRDGVRPMADVFAFHGVGSATLRAGQLAVVADGLMVSDNYFRALRVPALVGRLPSVEDGRDGAPLVAAISYNFWQREFGGDPLVLGRTLEINRRAATVIGVLPPGFNGVRPGDEPAFYVPLAAQPGLSPDGRTAWSRHAPDVWWLELGARVRPGISEARLRAGMGLAFARAASGIVRQPRMVVEEGRRGPDAGRQRYQGTLLLLSVVVGLVLLVACANLAGLMLARGAGQRRELAVRAAIGASRWRLARQALVESLALATLGAVMGMLCASWGRSALARLLAGSADGLRYDTSLDLTVFGFAAGTALVTAVLSGFLPAWRAARTDAAAGLRERGVPTPRLRVERLLVIAQIALTVVLVAGAGLFVRTLVKLAHIDPGFATENLLLFRLDAGARGYHDEQATAFYDRVQRALRPIPGVRSVALMDVLLLSGWMNGGGGFEVVGHPYSAGKQGSGMPPAPGAAPGPFAYRLTVGESFFRSLGIPLVLGRGFQEGDAAGAPRVVVVNQAFVRRYLDGQNAVGQVIRQLHPSRNDWQIVGVCRDAKYDGIRLDVPPTIYYSFRQNPPGGAFIALRTTLPPLSLAPAVRRAVGAVDPSVPLASVTTQTQVIQGSTSQQRLFALLCSALALLAVLLACIGLYGLIAYNVTRRTGELGIRAALGATARQLETPILRETLLLVGAGTLSGFALAYFLVSVVRNQLYGVQPRDPLTLALAVCGVIAIGLAAGWIPARRAGRMDPMAALRAE